MALTLTEVRKANPAHLTIIKKCQTLGNESDRPFLTNCSNSVWATYPVAPPEYHMFPGEQLELLAILSAKEAYSAHPCLKVRNSKNFEFMIFSTDIGRFLSL